MSCLYFVKSDSTSAYKLHSRSIETSVEDLDLSFDGNHLEVLEKNALHDLSHVNAAQTNVEAETNAADFRQTSHTPTSTVALTSTLALNTAQTEQTNATPVVNEVEPRDNCVELGVNDIASSEVATSLAHFTLAETDQVNSTLLEPNQVNSTLELERESNSQCTDPQDSLAQSAFPHKMVIHNFTKLSTLALLYVLHYRNLDDIRYNMVSDKEIDSKDHLAFCHNLAYKSDRMYLFSSFDGKPMSVASVHVTPDWSKIIDYGMYALGTNTPERNAVDDGRISVYAIDRIIIAHLILSRGVKSVDFMFKNTNHKSLYVNLKKHGTEIIAQDENYTHTRLECSKTLEFYRQQILDFCLKYNCSIEFDL